MLATYLKPIEEIWWFEKKENWKFWAIFVQIENQNIPALKIAKSSKKTSHRELRMVSIVFLQRRITIHKTLILGKFVYQGLINWLFGFISKVEDIFCELNSCSIFESNSKFLDTKLDVYGSCPYWFKFFIKFLILFFSFHVIKIPFMIIRA